MGLACYTARMSSVPLEQDEKISLCYLGLVLAARSFDPDRGIRFATFAVPVMQNKILQGLKREKKHFGVISLEQPAGKENGGTLADLVPDPGHPFRDLEEILDFQDAVKRTGRELSGKKLRLYQELLRNPGLAQKEYGERIGCSQSLVSRWMKEIRQKLCL